MPQQTLVSCSGNTHFHHHYMLSVPLQYCLCYAESLSLLLHKLLLLLASNHEGMRGEIVREEVKRDSKGGGEVQGEM